MKFEMRQGDLFNMPNQYVLAHCISRDGALGKGIAKTFRDKFPAMSNYIRGQEQVDFVPFVPYVTRTRIVANLVTKEKYWQKPTYSTVTRSLLELRKYMLDHKLTKLAMPKIAVGLDRLNWTKVSELINNTFGDTNIEVVVVEYKKG